MRLFAAIATANLFGAAGAEEPDRGFYIGVDAAGLDVSAGRRYGIIVGTPEIAFRAFPESVAVSGTDASWGAQIGYRISRFLAVELAYADFGSMLVTETYDLSTILDGPVVFERPVEFGASGPSLSWLGLIPLGGDFEAFVRVGVLLAEQEIRDLRLATLPGDSGRSISSETMSIYGIGAAYRLSKGWSVRAEFQNVDGLHGGGSQSWIDNLGPIRIRRYGLAAAYRF